jgi:hypothetical protein
VSFARWLRPGATSGSALGAPTVDGEKKMPLMHGLDELREQGRMTWIEAENGWSAALEDIMDALSKDGFEECKRETTTSRRDLRPTGGVWQGVNAGTGSVASAIWVGRPARARATVFVAIDGESVSDHPFSSIERDPYRDDGGES